MVCVWILPCRIGVIFRSLGPQVLCGVVLYFTVGTFLVKTNSVVPSNIVDNTQFVDGSLPMSVRVAKQRCIAPYCCMSICMQYFMLPARWHLWLLVVIVLHVAAHFHLPCHGSRFIRVFARNTWWNSIVDSVVTVYACEAWRQFFLQTTQLSCFQLMNRHLCKLLSLHYELVCHIAVLFFSRPRSGGWPHHERIFSIYLSLTLLRESCSCLVHPGCAWFSSRACTWHCSLHYLL